MANTMLELTGIHKAFGDNQVLRGIDLVVDKGEVVAVLGPSGSGKSTMLRCINHLETIDKGDIHIKGQALVEGGVYVDEKRQREVLADQVNRTALCPTTLFRLSCFAGFVRTDASCPGGRLVTPMPSGSPKSSCSRRR